MSDIVEKVKCEALCRKNNEYQHLESIRSRPVYWQKTQKDLFVLIRTLGIPTFFCSFSAADMRWEEMTKTILNQNNDSRRASDLSIEEKGTLIRENPVAAVRMFDFRFHKFLKEVIMSPAQPIGKVKDYFHRIEFQSKCSPHTHCLFWIDYEPQFGKSDIQELYEFIDKYITCELPDAETDPELYTIVTEVQTHSKNHNPGCKNKNTECRFGFPQLQVEEIFRKINPEFDQCTIEYIVNN